MTIIRIEVKEKPKLVLFYLNQKESADGKILKSIEDNAQAMKNLSYLSVMVEPGEDDLADSFFQFLHKPILPHKGNSKTYNNLAIILLKSIRQGSF